MKKVAEIFADSEKVTTFASAFEKQRFLRIRQRVYSKGARCVLRLEFQADAKFLKKFLED